MVVFGAGGAGDEIEEDILCEGEKIGGRKRQACNKKIDEERVSLRTTIPKLFSISGVADQPCKITQHLDEGIKPNQRSRFEIYRDYNEFEMDV